MVEEILDYEGSPLSSVTSGRNIKNSSKEINLEAPKMDREWEGSNFKH